MHENILEYKILYADLDGTLIKTISGKTFPEDPYGFQITQGCFG